MAFSMVASHSRGKAAGDKIFGASAAANAAKAKFGRDNVVDATIGVLLDDNESLVCLPTVEKVFRSMPMTDIIPYAPIAGLPAYLDAVIEACFLDNKPEAYIKSVATAGGSGSIHHAIWNYTELGDTVLCADWYWDPYRVLSDGLMRKIDTFEFFDSAQKFNVKSLEQKVNELLGRQDSILLILNTPAHNPVGYSLSDSDWDNVISVLKKAAKPGKKVTLFVDAAYLDFSGEKNECRAFFRKFGGLPANLLVLVGYSMSKGFTLYGQRTGAIIGVSSDKDVIEEFRSINQYTSRSTWSNINRGAMHLLATIYKDKDLLAQLDAERVHYYQKIKERSDIFAAEAKAANLKTLPYIAGFFLSIPSKDPDGVCLKLHEDNLFAVPLAKGVRIALCAVPAAKVKGMAAKIAKAQEVVEK